MTPTLATASNPSQVWDALNSYDHILVAFSGGKDSMACLLHLIECGVDLRKVELHHHLVDGREGSDFMDWPVTEDYCRQIAKAFGVPIFFSWKEGGLEREMKRNNAPTAPIWWEEPLPDGGLVARCKGGDGPLGTRGIFPQVTPNISQRYCSAYGKIDVMRRLINNDPRFVGKRTLILSGERGEESKARAGYAIFEPDATDNRDGKKVQRHVDRWRPVRDWEELEVWAIMERFRVRAHPAYYLGWGRCSCRGCIFGNANQFRSLLEVDPDGFARLADFEEGSGKTLKRNESLRQLVAKGKPYDAITQEAADLAMCTHHYLPVILPPGAAWQLPAGAFGESCGPS